MAEALPGAAWVHHVSGPRTVRLLAEFVLLSNKLEIVVLSPGVPDTFVWRFSADGRYSAALRMGQCSSGAQDRWGREFYGKFRRLQG